MASNPLSPERDENDQTAQVEVPLEDFGGSSVDYSGEFYPVQTFETYQEAVNWVKQMAIRLGFELTIASHKTGVKVLEIVELGGWMVNGVAGERGHHNHGMVLRGEW